MGRPEGRLLKQIVVPEMNLGLVAILILGIGYLGLLLSLNTTSPFLIAKGISMEPTIHAGDMLLNKRIPASEIIVGDIIAFAVPPKRQEKFNVPPIVAHRVIKIVEGPVHLAFVTQGDNSNSDPYEVPYSAIHGVVASNLGPLAVPILFLGNKSVLIIGGISILAFFGIALAALSFLPNDREPNYR